MSRLKTNSPVIGAVKPEEAVERRDLGMQVEFDRYSMILNGERTFIRSGAMHYFRLPSQELWADRLFKLKAAGYNCVDLYFNWNYHSPEQGVYDFSGIRDVRKLMEITKSLGLYVIARPGPYINAEYSGGGFPGWMLAKRDLPLRNRREGAFEWSDEYMGYLREWWEQIIPIINSYDNVLMVQIENEYATLEVEPDYMRALYEMTREMGVKVPLFHNDLYVAGLYSDIVDIYSFDNYSVTQFEHDWRDMPEIFQVLDNAENNLRPFCEASPLMVAELQAGWYGTWKGYSYETINEYLGREHIGLTTKSVIGQGLTVVNHYKAIGGTNWDHTGSIETYTSYDFGAPISEAGVNTERLFEAKAINAFLQSFDLSATERMDKHADPAQDQALPFAVSDPDAYYLTRRNIQHDNEYWIFLRNVTKQVRHVKIDNGEHYEVTIAPFEALMLPYHAHLKCGGIIEYSTVEPLYQSEEALFLKANRPTKIKLRLPEFDGEPKISYAQNDSPIQVLQTEDGCWVVSAPELDHPTLSCVSFGGYTLWLLGQQLVDTFWLEPGGRIVLGADERLKDAYGFAPDVDTAYILSLPYRETESRTISHPKTAHLPELKGWKAYHEAFELYSDATFQPVSKNGADFDSNGFYEGSCWYRYALEASAKTVQVEARHIWAVYLNGHLLQRDSHLQLIHGVEAPPAELIVLPQPLMKASDNELVIFVDGLGHPKGFHDDSQTPQGLITLSVDGQDVTQQVTFSAGYSSEKKDLQMACGGACNPVPKTAPIVRFDTTFEWPADSTLDVPVGLSLAQLGHFNRINIYLNGMLLGRHWRECQRQDTFYLPTGVLKSGQNKLSLLVMNFEPLVPVDDGLLSAEHICLTPYGVFTKVDLEAKLSS